MSITTTPLTPSQLHLWKSQTISPDKPLFNQIVTARLPINTDDEHAAEAMCAAWIRVQHQHPVLGSTIRTQQDLTPVQHYEANVHAMEQVDLSSGSHCQPDTVQQWIVSRGKNVFALHEKLTDAVLIRCAEHQLVVFLNMHHLIADAISTQQVLNDLLSEFQKIQRTGLHTIAYPSPPPTGTLQFQEYAHAMATHSLATCNSHEQAPTASNAASGEPSRPSFYGRANAYPVTDSVRRRLHLSEDQHQALQALAADPELRQLNPNLFALCFHTSALALYLHKATGEHHIIIEAPITGRFEPQWMHVVGNFIEMVRLDITVNPSQSLIALYQQVRDALFLSLRQAHSGCTGNLKPGPVHGVVNLIVHDRVEASGWGDTVQWHHSGHSDSHHPLRLHIADWGGTGRPSLELDVNLGFFAKVSQEQPCQHLESAYRALITCRQTPINTLSLLGPNETWQLHAKRTRSASAFVSLSRHLESVCHSTPDAVALIDETTKLSYRELHELIHRVSKALHAAGVTRQDRVAVVMRRSIHLPIMLLSIMHRGAVYVPVDHQQPAARIQQILQDAQVSCVVADATAQSAEEPGQWGMTNVLLADTLLMRASENTAEHTHWQASPSAAAELSEPQRLPAEPQASDPAYIIFTSGSTGTPKGVVVSHGALMSYLSWANDYYALVEPVIMPLHTSIGFDMTVTSLFLPLVNGGSIKVFSETGHSEQAGALALFSVMADNEVNTIKLTPSHLALMTDSVDPGTSIRQLIVGGEDLKCSTAREAAGRFSQPIRIINEYGPSEATVGCIVSEWHEAINSKSVPIGVPISGMSAYVLDTDGLPQFEGAVGELYLAGDSLAQGYWNNPDQTRAAFVDNPWMPGTRLYRTGDLVCVANQQLLYLGRQDTQVKHNGYRIELAEIEATLAAHPAVADCAVLLNNPSPDTRAHQDSQQPANREPVYCSLCGLSSLHPQGRQNQDGLCEICTAYLPNAARINHYFRDTRELRELIAEIQRERQGDYDAVVLLSGGKDSTYAIAQLVDLGLKVYAFSLDNGFLSDQARENIDTVCKRLDIDHIYATTEHMNDIFADSLARYSNVCHGCFKTIYTLSMQFAEQHNINTVFTGLSRGQLFETRLSNELFADTSLPLNKIDEMVQAARIQYHAVPDAPNRLLNIQAVNSGVLPRKIRIIDFYRYCHVELGEMIHYLRHRVGWVRPPDTGRSTNCLINDVGIHVHKLEQGFHNYSLPYSWDVRLGHKRREEALDELNDEIDTERVETILHTIGYQPAPDRQSQPVLHAYLCSSAAVPEQLPVDSLKSWLETQLPYYMRPSVYTVLPALPLNANGKIDRSRLRDSRRRVSSTPALESLTDTEKMIANVWSQFISAGSINRQSDFFKLGGDSLAAIRCVVTLRGMGFELEPVDLFRTPLLSDFSRLVEHSRGSAPAPTRQKSEKFSSLDTAQREKLQKLLARKAPEKAR